MLNIYYGRESVDQEKFIFSHLDKKSRALIIVPDQYTLEAERKMFEDTGAEALIDCEVLSMSRLGSRLLQELGGSTRTFIDKYGRHMILSGVTRDRKDDLQVFKGLETKNSFLEMVNNFISEMKQFNSGLDELKSIQEQVEEGTYTSRKLHDLAMIYGEYEERIKGKYTDSEDYIDLFLGKIGQSELVRGNTIWIYGFDSFAPKALSVIGELMTYAKDVNVVLTCSLNRSDRDSELFDLGRLVMRNLINTAETRRIDHVEMAIPEDMETYPDHERFASARHLEKEIYALPSRAFRGPSNSVLPILVEASNLYNEAENAAAYVLHLIRDEGYKLGDIKIILNDQDVRGPIIKRVFEEYGLDIFMDQGRAVEDNPIIRYILSLFDVVLDNYNTPQVMAMVKTGLTGIDNDEAADLENYVIKYRIKGTMWKKPFTKGTLEYDEEALSRLNAARERVIKPCEAFSKCFNAEDHSEFVSSAYGFLRDDIDLPGRIKDLVDSQLEEERADLAEETDQVWDAFLRVMDQIKEIMGDEPFDGKTMRELLEVGLSGIRVGMLPPTKDGLLMGTMQRTRTGKVRALVVVGANEGILPSGKPPQGLFGEEEKELFKDRGIELMKLDKVALMEEKMGIYRNLARSGERLYMSYSMSDLDGNSAKPSPIWLKLKEIFPDVKVTRDAVSDGNYKVLVNGEMSGLRHIANAVERTTEGEAISEDVIKGLDWYKTYDKDKIEGIRKSLSFTNKVEEIGKETAEMLYKKDPSRNMSVSPSRIEKFSRCPFSHFVSYGLRPDERRVFEVAPREIGDIYHKCLMELTAKLSVKGLPVTDPASPWMTITDEELRELIENFVNDQTGSYHEGVFRQGNEEKYKADRIMDTCFDVAKTLIEQVRAGQILEGKFEARFGRGCEIPPIEINLGDDFDGEKAYIEGVIDRVDYLPDSRVKIIDYKTGDEKFVIKEAEKGYRLQLMLYLKAAMEKDKKPAGVFYFHIKEPKVNMTGKISEDAVMGQAALDEAALKDAIAKDFKLNGVIVNDPEVIRNIAGDFKGYSPIVQLFNGKEGVKSGSKGEERLLSEEAFEELKNTVSGVVAENVVKLLKGNADIHPMKTKNTSACNYCQYKGICRFDTIFDGNKWNPID